MRVHLVRRWGQHQGGQTVDVGDVQGQWLLDRGFARPVQDEARAAGDSSKPEADGADAGADAGAAVSGTSGKGARRGRSAGARKASGSGVEGRRSRAGASKIESGPDQAG